MLFPLQLQFYLVLVFNDFLVTNGILSGLIGLGAASMLMPQDACFVPYCQARSQQCCLLVLSPNQGLVCPSRC